MIPRSVMCDRCGAWLRDVMAEESDRLTWDMHPRLGDCIRILAQRITKLEAIGGANG